MAEFEAWIAECHMLGIEGDEELRCRAAVWANSVSEFRAQLDVHLKRMGYKTLWIEECLRASEYIRRHGQQQKIGALARAVHPDHTVEVGTLKAVGTEGEDAPESQYLTITEHEIPPLPDQSGIPLWDQEWIAPELKELLFGQPEDGAKLRTYFIVDGTLRKNIRGVFDLDSGMVDVPIQCLFKGEAAEDFKAAAPYLIDMTLPDGACDDRDLVSAFHKDFFKKHWGKNTGIFIRTPALMADVWGHFRKFVRLQREDTKSWVFFRFWDARIAYPYFAHISDWSERCSAWFRPRGAASITNLVIEAQEGSVAKQVLPDLKALTKVTSLPSQFLFLRELEAFKVTQIDKFDDTIAKELQAQMPVNFVGHAITQQNYSGFVEIVRKDAETKGFQSSKSIMALCMYSLDLGLGFMNDPRFSTRYLNNIKDKISSEAERLAEVESLYKYWETKILTQEHVLEGFSYILSSIENERLSYCEVCPEVRVDPQSQQGVDFRSTFIRHLKQKEPLDGFRVEVALGFAVLLGVHWHVNPVYADLWEILCSENWREGTQRAIEHITRGDSQGELNGLSKLG